VKATIHAIHVEQFEGWWKLSPDEWRELLKGGIEGNGHELPRTRMLKRRSRHVGATDYGDGEGRNSYFARRDGILIYSPLDWEPENYADALAELDELTGEQAP
jgi:hypothetical protein